MILHSTFIPLIQPLIGWPAAKNNKNIIFYGNDEQKVFGSWVELDTALQCSTRSRRNSDRF
jgi:hypothetical protein